MQSEGSSSPATQAERAASTEAPGDVATQRVGQIVDLDSEKGSLPIAIHRIRAIPGGPLSYERATGQGPGWLRGIEARWIFEQEVEADDSAEALEGLSWAAWWLDDAKAVFAARERAYRLYKKDEGPTSAARMGHVARSRSLRLPRRSRGGERLASERGAHARGTGPRPDQGWLDVHEATSTVSAATGYPHLCVDESEGDSNNAYCQVLSDEVYYEAFRSLRWSPWM
jgi:hypothetical protein